jgi:hypothetical protein
MGKKAKKQKNEQTTKNKRQNETKKPKSKIKKI